MSGFLEHFDRRYRGRNGNFFYTAIRHGLTEPREICSAVFQEARRRLDSPYGDEEQRQSLREVLAWLRDDPEGALALARSCIEWENASPEERQAAKAEQEAAGKREWMQTQPPTEKQLALLAKLGHTAAVANRQAASELIERLKTW